jgi:hypothetical protein
MRKGGWNFFHVVEVSKGKTFKEEQVPTLNVFALRS